MLVLMIPIILIFVGQPPRRGSVMGGRRGRCAVRSRDHAPQAFRDVAFLTVSIAFALVLFAQVGFIVHLIAFLDPVIGRADAAIAVRVVDAMAVAGRVLFSTVIDRLNQRLASAISFASQAVALAIIINSRQRDPCFRSAGPAGAVRVLGPAMMRLIHAAVADSCSGEFDPRIVRRAGQPRSPRFNQVTYAFGARVVHRPWLRDFSRSLRLPFYGCIAIDLRGRGPRDHASCAASALGTRVKMRSRP